MTDDPRDPSPEPDDPAADTAMFQAFAQREDPPPPPRQSGSAFRVTTLLIGLAVFAALVWLLLR